MLGLAPVHPPYLKKQEEPLNPAYTSHLRAAIGGTTMYNPFSAKGRLNRTGFLGVIAIAATAKLVLFLAIALFIHRNIEGTAAVASVTAMALLAATAAWFTCAQSVRRLHDIAKRGEWVVVAFIPAVNLVFYLYLLVAPGTTGTNRFGR